MSLTVNTTIADHSAAFAPIVVNIESSRQTENASIDITAVANGSGGYAGYVRLTVAALTNLEADDCITISGATGDYVYLNGRHNIWAIDVPNKYVYLYTAHQSASSGDPGGLIRSNGAVKIKTVLTVDSVAIATFYSYPILNDEDIAEANIDLAPFLQPLFQSDFRLTAGAYTSTSSKSEITFSVSFYEMHQKADYTFFTSAASQQTGKKAHRTVDVTTRILNDATVGENQWLTDRKTVVYPAGESIILHGICTEASAYIRKEDTTVSPATVTHIEVTGGVKKDHVIYVYKPEPAIGGGVYPTFNVCLQNNTADSPTWRSEIIYFKPDSKCYPNDRVLYFTNRYGGWDVYQFREISKRTFKADKTQNRTFQFITGTANETKLQGRPETVASLEVLKDMITAPEVYDTTEKRVYIRDVDFVIKEGDGLVIPEITIVEYEDEFING